MEYLNLILTLVSGIIGGNLAGAALGEKSLGGIGNSIVGLLGGWGGDFLLKALGVLGTAAATSSATGGSLDLASILAAIGGGAGGGAILTAIIGLIKGASNK